MSVVVGLVLLVVFLVFAVLMFLERLSALLTLPLLALTFVLIAAVADIARPLTVTETVSRETTDALGRRTVTREETTGPSRYETWKQIRLTQRRLLHDKVMLLGTCLEEIESAAPHGFERVRQALGDLRVRAQAFESQARTSLDALPGYFARPPHYAGPRADFDEALRAIPVLESLQDVATILDENPFDADGAGRLRAILDRTRRESAQALRNHPPPPAAASLGFRLGSASSYLLHHLLATVRAGSLWLYQAIIASIFGGMFAVYIKNLKVAERMVYWTAEFAGERPFLIAVAVFLVTGVIFTSVGGLGTVIMLGTIILPILRSVGIGPLHGAGIFLIAISMGGTLQPVARRLWMDFYRIPPGQLDSILWTMVGLYAACGLVWTYWATRRRHLSNFSAVPSEEVGSARSDVPARLMIAPLIPVLLVYLGRIEEITAFTVSLVYMYACVFRRPGALRIFTRSLIEGAQTVMPPVLLMIGIGILLAALFADSVQGYLRPLLAYAVPDSRWGYIATFAIGAPLALYRGPLNVWGMGLAVSGTLLATSSLPRAAILCAVLSAGMLQSVCDPTNTANVWIAGFQGVTATRILRATLLVVWATAVVAVVVFGFRYVPA